MALSLLPPSREEISAVERVLSEAHNQPVDGYWRSIAEACCEAQKDAQLKGFLRETVAEFERRMDYLQDAQDDARFEAAAEECR